MKNTVFFTAFFFLCTTLHGQENEFKSWNAIEYGLDINKKWSIDFSQHYRLKEDLTLVDNIITQTELYYKPVKRLKIAAQFRYNYRNDTNGRIQGFENMLRYRIGAEKKIKVKRGNFAFRVMYQNRYSIDRENRSKKVVRYRPSFEWKIKNWSYDPRFYIEYLNEIKGDEQNSYRFGVGTKAKFSKTRALSFRYFYQTSKEPNRLDRTAHVISLKYVFTKKDKEKEEDKKETN